MKYLLLFCDTAERRSYWESLTDDQRDQGMAIVGQWFGQNADKLVSTHQLQPPSTARTVHINGNGAVVTDGPFIEAKEVIGGYAIFELGNEEDAIELAKTWPAGGTVEVRPLVER